MCTFAHAADATKFCAQIQHRLLSLRWPKTLFTQFCARVEDDCYGRVIWKVPCTALTRVSGGDMTCAQAVGRTSLSRGVLRD